jgi:outer membrane protein OmpA-like peptidoglycan-associated protein
MKSLILCVAACSLAALAQKPAPVDRAGCVESKIVTRMPGCVILRCENKDFAAAAMPRTKNDRSHQVEGQLERTVYRCPAGKSPLELGRNTEAALRNAGFQILYTDVYAGGARFYMTAQKGPHWVNLYVVSDAYDLTVVKQKQMEQAMTANADGWTDQVKQTGRVSVYGINFDTGKASIRAGSETVLNELAKMLQGNPSWAMLVAGHTDNVGAKEMNLALSRQRAESVIAWLASHGVDKTRLVPAGFGDARPVAPNADEEGRQKNRRVDLVKVY